ncbi:MAG TPA: class I SAM-dependent methyltransferase [Polyangiaceae bacterium]|nr:class I SAM-dependent methyltransferase [Polyangiaceae bacterium]
MVRTTSPASPDDDRCGLCGGTGRPFRTKYGYRILRCASCDNAFVPRSAVPADLESIYGKGYFEGAEETGYPGYLADSKIITRNFRDRLRAIEALHPPGKRLLDVGAAYGLFLKEAREAGWDASGVEIAPDCALEAAKISGAPVACGDFVTVPLEGPYDVIVMLDVIEHFRDPVAVVRRAHELLSPGGLLVIDTGDLDTPWAKLLGDRWYFLDPPQHLFYFSERGLRTVLRKGGFSGEIRRTRPGRRVSLTNISFKLAAGAPKGPLRTGLGRLAKANLPGAVYLNFGDGMLMSARKT